MRMTADEYRKLTGGKSSGGSPAKRKAERKRKADREMERIAYLAKIGHEAMQEWRVPTRSKSKNKYGAVKVDGHASQKELKRAGELKLMQLAGEISNLREQVPFELIPTQYGDCGTDLKGRPVRVLLERSCRYVADFVYNDKLGNLVVEDTKGFRTKDYKIKRKLMLYVHGIRIKET